MILSICDVPEVLKVMKIVKVVILAIKIAVPIMLIISLMIDYTKVIVSKDSDALVKTNRLSVNKAAALVLLFLVPTFVKIIIQIAPDFTYSACLNNATDAGIKASYESTMKKYMDSVKLKLDSSTYTLAVDYLKNIEDEELKRKYQEELEVINKKIEEEKKKKEEKEETTTVSKRPDPMAPYAPGLLKGDTFLETARNVWERIVLGEKNFRYEQGNYVPVMTNFCDCSTYVSWVIYEYGYTDFYGRQRTCKHLYNTNYRELYGWEEYYYPARTDLTFIVRPGDIVVRRTEGSGHTNIIASVKGGVVYGYDCGDSKWVKHGEYPNGIPNPYFIKDAQKHRPAKIIRVKKR